MLLAASTASPARSVGASRFVGPIAPGAPRPLPFAVRILVFPILCYGAPAAPAWPASSRFSGTNLLAMKVAPWGSEITVILTQGASNGGAITLPPLSVAFFAVARRRRRRTSRSSAPASPAGRRGSG